MVCAHQDVYFPKGWFHRLAGIAEDLEQSGNRWGVLGLVGVTRARQIVGRAFSVGLGGEVGSRVPGPAVPAVSLDEIVLVVNRAAGVSFDSNLPAFHLYGTDLAQTCISRDWPVLVVENPVIHNSLPVRFLGRDYAKAYHYMRRKWRDRLPIPTTIVPITRSGWPLWRWRLRSSLRRITRRSTRARRHPAPEWLAVRLGYAGGASEGRCTPPRGAAGILEAAVDSENEGAKD